MLSGYGSDLNIGLTLAQTLGTSMSKPRKQSSGFSNTPKTQSSRKKPVQSSADQPTKEQKAVALIKQGNLREAEEIYRELIATGTRNHIVYGNLAALCGMQRKFDELIKLLHRELELKPNYAEAHNKLGAALKEQGDLSAAIVSYKTALQLKPNYPEAHNNMGLALQEQDELPAAIVSYNSALQLKPNYPEAHNNMGLALHEQSELTAAIASFNTALQLKPNYPEARWNSSLTMLLGRDYENGWEEYEWRSKKEKENSIPHAIPKCVQWSGELPLNQASQLLLVTEQGLGDTLQFMRYATALRNEGISVSLCAQPKLHSLIQASGIDPSPLTPRQANEVAEGEWIPLLSVPRLLEVSPSNPVITEPYIKTTEELTAKWASTLGAKEYPVVGINWQGNPKIEKRGLRGRSLELETFAPITSNKKISLLSLQMGFGSEQVATCSF